MADRRLFFGLWPTERQREALRGPIKAVMGPMDGQPVPRANWHVTLVFLGNVAERHVDELLLAASEVEVKPFRLRLDRVEFWPRPKIACLLATAVPPALEAVQRQLEDISRRFGYQSPDILYRPHLTIARPARPFTAEPLAQPVMLEWSGFELLESVSTARGVQYSPLKQGSTDNS